MSTRGESNWALELLWDTELTGIKPLQGEHNFTLWKAQAKLHLKALKLWEITSGTTPRPTVVDPELDVSSAEAAICLEVAQKAWDKSNERAQCFLTCHIDGDMLSDQLIGGSAPELWTSIMRRFHRQSPILLQCALTAVVNISYTDNSTCTIAEHLDAFQRCWMQLVRQTDDVHPPTATNSPLQTALRATARSSEAKAAFLISSLPKSMEDLVDSLLLRHRDGLKYHHVYDRLMDRHESDERRRAEELKGMDCTWCKSRGFESAGHTWKRCHRLSEFNKVKARRREHDLATTI